MTLYWGGRRPTDLYDDGWVRARLSEMPQLRYVPVVSDALPEDLSSKVVVITGASRASQVVENFEAMILERGIAFRHTDETDAVFPHAYTFNEGSLHPGEAPGLGVDIDEARARGLIEASANPPGLFRRQAVVSTEVRKNRVTEQRDVRVVAGVQDHVGPRALELRDQRRQVGGGGRVPVDGRAARGRRRGRRSSGSPRGSCLPAYRWSGRAFRRSPHPCRHRSRRRRRSRRGTASIRSRSSGHTRLRVARRLHLTGWIVDRVSATQRTAGEMQQAFEIYQAGYPANEFTGLAAERGRTAIVVHVGPALAF
mgnify:CR=1 FL=1